MSRCFPFPPPGYVRNGIRDEALIESIKLQREGEKAKKERKKEKKRERREKEKTRGSGEIESKKHSHKKQHKDERSKEDHKGGEFHKRTEKETEQLEKSSLTEEYGPPAGSQTSSDSTLDSNKRQKMCLPSDGRHNSGSIIRIRLPLQRHKDPEVLPGKEQHCLAPRTDDASIQVMHEPAPPIAVRKGIENSTTSRKICPEFTIRLSKEKPCIGPGRPDDASIQLMHEPASKPGGERVENPCSTSRTTFPELALRLSKEKHRLSTSVSESSAEKPCLSIGASERPSQVAETSTSSKLCGSCSPQLASKFQDVIENWVPPPMPGDGTVFSDQEWLFETKLRSEDKRCEMDGVVGSDPANSTTWPRVCYLPEADVYALPFTVPF